MRKEYLTNSSTKQQVLRQTVRPPVITPATTPQSQDPLHLPEPPLPAEDPNNTASTHDFSGQTGGVDPQYAVPADAPPLKDNGSWDSYTADPKDGGVPYSEATAGHAYATNGAGLVNAMSRAGHYLEMPGKQPGFTYPDGSKVVGEEATTIARQTGTIPSETPSPSGATQKAGVEKQSAGETADITPKEQKAIMAYLKNIAQNPQKREELLQAVLGDGSEIMRWIDANLGPALKSHTDFGSQEYLNEVTTVMQKQEPTAQVVRDYERIVINNGEAYLYEGSNGQKALLMSKEAFQGLPLQDFMKSGVYGDYKFTLTDEGLSIEVAQK